MRFSAIANLIDIEQSVKEVYYLPDKAEETALVAKVITFGVRRLIGISHFTVGITTELAQCTKTRGTCISCVDMGFIADSALLPYPIVAL